MVMHDFQLNVSQLNAWTPQRQGKYYKEKSIGDLFEKTKNKQVVSLYIKEIRFIQNMKNRNNNQHIHMYRKENLQPIHLYI